MSPLRPHLLRARRAVRRHHRPRRAPRGGGEGLRGGPGGHDRVRHGHRLRAAARVDRREARRRRVAGHRHERVDAGRRVPLRHARRARGRGRRRAPDVRPDAARPAPARRRDRAGRPRARRDRRRRAGEAARGRPAPEARAHHPQLPEPGRLHALAREARPAAGARPRVRLPRLRGRPVRRAALRGRDAPDDALARRVRPRRLRVVVLQDRVPRHPRRLPRRARRTSSPRSSTSRRTRTSRRTWSPSRS